jgi:hypothetical protein
MTRSRIVEVARISTGYDAVLCMSFVVIAGLGPAIPLGSTQPAVDLVISS